MDGWLIVMIIMVAVSGLFIILGCLGLHRFPDVFTRLHAATKATTFGSIFLSLAVIVYGIQQFADTDGGDRAAFITLISHTVLALIFLLLTNPTGAHAIAKAARRSGIEPEQAVIDEWEEVE
jgi:multicomponent Na+:H+ antiporter subunit G